MPEFKPCNAAASYIQKGKRADWLAAPMTGTLKVVPGIADGMESKLREQGITSVFQLIGEFLKCKGEGVGSIEHCERFYMYLSSVGVGGSSRPTIVLALAEKMNIMIPGFFDMEDYPEEERANY